MPNVSLTNFKYMFPRFEHHLLPDTASYQSIDADSWSGGLQAFRGNTLALDVTDFVKESGMPKSFYRFYDGARSQWLFFDKKTSAVRSPVLADLGNMCFISGLDNYVRVFSSDTLDPAHKTLDDTNSYKAGIARPSAPILSTVAQSNPGALATKVNAYRIAFIRKWDTYWDTSHPDRASNRVDLGPMSAPALTAEGTTTVVVDKDKCAKVSNIKKTDTSDSEHVVLCAVYRNDNPTEGTGKWREVVRFPLKTVDLPAGVGYDADTDSWYFVDTVADTALGAVATNEDWTMPDRLSGIVSLRNGIVAGFVNNTVYLSVPYMSHAFPESQSVTTDFEIVGLGSFQNTLVICTEGNTYLCVCNDPTLPILTPIQEAQSCVSADSIVSLRDSIIYAAPYGLIQVDGNGSRQVTEDVIGSFKWGQYNPSSIYAAACYEGNYLFYFTSNQVPYQGAIFNVTQPTVGILGLSFKPFVIWRDDTSTDVYMILLNPNTNKYGIYSFGKSYSTGLVYTWVSKKFLNLTGLTTPAAVKVNFLKEFTRVVSPTYEDDFSSGSLNEPVVNRFSLNGDASTWSRNVTTFGSQMCKLEVYGDDELWDSITITDSDFYRVRSGCRFGSFYVRITSTLPIMKIQIATSAGELE